MITVLQGDCIEKMRRLSSESVHLIVTSPPYWGLRDYGVPPSIWPESEEASDGCEHEWIEHLQPAANGILHDGGMSGETLSGKSATRRPKRSGFCQVCNAWREVFGLEPTPELYIAHLVAIIREAKRILRSDGTLWLNLGDSYAASGGDRRDHGNGFNSVVGKTADAAMPRAGRVEQQRHFKNIGIKPGDLVGIPWRAVFALQADGWWHRRDNIWFKPNPMPESVNGWRWEQHRINRTDCPGCDKCTPNGGLILRKGNWRCTTSHEYVFQFSKSDSYFCDAEAAREVRGTIRPEGPDSRMAKSRVPRERDDKPNPSRSLIRASGNKQRFIARKDGERGRLNNHLGSGVPWVGLQGNRNRRSVWRIAVKPYRGAHFATFPPDLVRPIIAAASPVHCCGECGAPYAPVVMRGAPDLARQRASGGDLNGQYGGKAQKNFIAAGAEDASAVKARILAGMVVKTVVDHRPTCACSILARVPDPAAAIVLDPFGGSGTVGQVAQELGRSAILIELSEAYIPLIEKRCALSLP